MPSSIFSSYSILVADPNPFMAKILTAILIGFEVRRVVSLQDEDEAKALIQESAVDCVLLDWFDSFESSLELVDYIRRGEASPDPELPIVLCTGFTEYGRILFARDIGVSEIVTKPVVPEQVLEKLAAALFNRRSFVVAEDYVGPDRRRRDKPWDGRDRREGSQLSQDEIDNLMARA